MRITVLFLLIIFNCNLSLFAQVFENFDKFFTDKTMRIDYFHVGDAKSEIITIDQIYIYGIWSGSRLHLIDEFNVGRYYVNIYDKNSETLIYSKGFDSYFGEYQTSQAALDRIKKTYQESSLIPYPKGKIIFTLEKRNK